MEESTIQQHPMTVEIQLGLLRLRRDHIKEYIDEAVRNGATIRDRGGLTEFDLMNKEIEYLRRIIKDE